MNTLKLTIEQVKRIYLATRGMLMDVDGTRSMMSSWNRVRERSMEIQREIFSPESHGRQKVRHVSMFMDTHGMIRFT